MTQIYKIKKIFDPHKKCFIIIVLYIILFLLYLIYVIYLIYLLFRNFLSILIYKKIYIF